MRLLKPIPGHRIGLFGGTFDPPHWGHIKAARTAADELNLDQLAFLPSPYPPHKGHQVFTNYSLRKRMIQLCLKYDRRFRICLVEEEARLSGTTLETVQHLRKIGYDERCCKLIWLMGSDSLLDFPYWHQPEELLQIISVAVMPRPGFPIENAERRFLDQLQVLKTPLFDISATAVRTGQLDLKKTLPKPVVDFIYQQNLYGFRFSDVPAPSANKPGN